MLLALLLAAGAGAAPADPDLRFLQDYAETKRWSLGRPVKVQPTPDGTAVLFLRSPPRKQEPRLFRFDVATGQTSELITPEQILAGKTEELSAEERARRERMRITGRGFTGFELSQDGKLVLVMLSGRAYVVPVAGGAAKQVAGPGAKGEPIFDARLSPDARKVSFVRSGELWVAPLAGGRERQITRGATDLVTHAQAEFVAQEELHRFTGYWWSPDSKWLVYEEADNRGVEKLWLGDPARPAEPIRPAPYPRPGKPNAKIAFGIVSAEGGPTTWIDWDKRRWEYVARVEWQEHGPLALELLSRDQKDLSLVAVDPHSGRTRELWREHDAAWVEAAHDWWWLATGEFLWSSESGGEWQLQLHAADGKLLRSLTPPDFGYAPPERRSELGTLLRPVAGLLHVDEKARVAYVARTPDPQDEQIYAVSLDGGAPRGLTRGPDLHTGVFAREAKTWVRTSWDGKGRKVLEVIAPDGRNAGELPSVAEPYPFEPRVEIRKIGPPPGFYASVVRPRELDPRRKYPVWLQVYGGPSAAAVVPFTSYYLIDQWIADHGYLVVRIDNRGTTGRGHAWERAILHSLADVPLEDQVTALQALAQVEPSMDLQHVGIYGHSYGGFLAALALARRPDVFRAAVASAPVVDWMNYDTAYTERYLGVPPPAGKSEHYPRNGVLQSAARLERPILIVHGTADDNVHFSESLLLADALFRAGKPFGFLPLAGTTHMFADPALQVREWQRVFDFFEEHLRAASGPARASGGAP